MQIFCTDTTLLYCDSRFYVHHASLAKRCTAFQIPFGKRAIRFYHVAKVAQKAGMRFLPGYTILCKCNIRPFLPHSRMLQNQIRHKWGSRVCPSGGKAPPPCRGGGPQGRRGFTCTWVTFLSFSDLFMLSFAATDLKSGAIRGADFRIRKPARAYT